MVIGGVRAALHKAPFEPFMIRLADGRSEPVFHPDFVALSNRHVYIVREDDTWLTIEPLLIVSLDSISKRSKGSNDSAKKKPKS